MLILTKILLLILVDFKTHVNISVSHDANLGARFFLFLLPILLQIGIVMLTLTGILAFIQVYGCF